MRHLVITIGCEYGAKGNAIGRKNSGRPQYQILQS